MYTLAIIDDDKFLLESMIKHINFSELNIHLIGTAYNGQTGLDIIKSTKPDIVISDIDMPELNGIELLKETSKLINPPLVILLTGIEELQYAQDAIYNNAFAYLTKPAFPPEIIKTLKHAVTEISLSRLYDRFEVKHILKKQNKKDYLTYIHSVSHNIYNLCFFELDKLRIEILHLITEYVTAFNADNAEILSETEQIINSLDNQKDLADYMKSAIEELEMYSSSKLSVSEKTVEDIKAYIDENYFDSDLSINRLVELFNISPNYLRTCFKKKYTLSFKDYLTSLRLQKANQLLSERKYKIYEIANKVGYKDIRQFRAAYKNYYGHIPSMN